MESNLPSVLVLLEEAVRDRLLGWPAEWEGYHWPGYTYEHTLRVRDLALRLARAEQADEQVVLLAGLLHDIAKAHGKTHAAVGADEAHNLLGAHAVDGQLRTRVCDAIRTHAGDNTADSPAESLCLGDADLIDANFGLVAVWRFITIRAGHDSPLHDSVLSMREWLPKKDALLDALLTRTGRLVARQRSARMHVFCEQLVEQMSTRTGGGTYRLADIATHIHVDRGTHLLADQVTAIELAARQGPVEDAVLTVCRSLRAEIRGLH